MTFNCSLWTLLLDLYESFSDSFFAGVFVINDAQDLGDTECVNDETDDAGSHGLVDRGDGPEDEVTQVLSLSCFITLSYDGFHRDLGSKRLHLCDRCRRLRDVLSGCSRSDHLGYWRHHLTGHLVVDLRMAHLGECLGVKVNFVALIEASLILSSSRCLALSLRFVVVVLLLVGVLLALVGSWLVVLPGALLLLLLRLIFLLVKVLLLFIATGIASSVVVRKFTHLLL